jgi:hypothetical protein
MPLSPSRTLSSINGFLVVSELSADVDGFVLIITAEKDGISKVVCYSRVFKQREVTWNFRKATEDIKAM